MGVLTGLAIASLALQGYSMIRGAQASKKMGEAQQRAAESGAELQEYNASVADVQAQDALERGAEQESNYRAGVRGLVGQQRTGFAAAGIDVGYGSAVDVQADTAMLGELDALTIRTNAAREAWGYQVEGYDLRQRARIARTEGVYLEAAGRAHAQAELLGGAGSLLGGAVSVYQTRYGMNPKRTPPIRPTGLQSGVPSAGVTPGSSGSNFG